MLSIPEGSDASRAPLSLDRDRKNDPMYDILEDPATDRIITRTDNNPPEPVGLLVAAEIPDAHKQAAEELRTNHLDTLLMFLRAPAVIESQDVYSRVTALSVMVKKAFEAIDKSRTTAKKAYLDGGTAIDKVYALPVEIDDPEKPGEKKTVKMLAELKGAHDALKKRLSVYDTAEYKKAEEARLAEAAAIAAAAAHDGIVMEAGRLGDGKMESSRSEHGGIAIKSVEKTFRIIDPDQVPANLCSPDPEKIRAAIDAGALKIAGVQIDVAVKTHVR
ncbi:hypothetical protein [Sphingomonas sp. 3-13AW]|uniref:hypothetical protein n=1 Tax=Sphingomonas sp. 3-13AW TaxID=3050450 RepID=UPI003BB54CDF